MCIQPRFLDRRNPLPTITTGGELVPTFEFEVELKANGYSLVAGIDEAGRGPLAGPVVAAAVILDCEGPVAPWLSLVDDSKVLSPLQRRKAYQHIQDHALAIGVGAGSPQEIDSNGIVETTKAAMLRAIQNLSVRPEYLLIDFVKLPTCGIPFEALVKGDSRCYCIAAASIVAKVTRDRMMEQWDREYPGYGFSQHKGYLTREHERTLQLHGPSPIHRLSFAPLRHQYSREHGGELRTN
jgi:ribonuclease HII